MAKVTLHGQVMETVGDLPSVKAEAPAFSLATTDLSDVGLQDFPGKNIVLNIFPSIDTPVCAATVRRFNKEAAENPDTVVLCISADLPFAHQRFCEVEGLKDVIPLSTFRSQDFGKRYGVMIKKGPLAGLMSRAIIVIDKDGKVKYTEHVMEISQEPDYDKALEVLSALKK